MDFTIGALAKKAKVNLPTLRYYEQRGLLVPTRRAGSGYRLYNEESLGNLKFIRHAQTYGFSLDEIRPLLKLQPFSPADCRRALRKVEVKIKQIGRRIEALERTAHVLECLAEECRKREGKGPCPILSRFYRGGFKKGLRLPSVDPTLPLRNPAR